MAGSSVIPLSETEAREILSAKIDNILIGGQALAIWANHYEVAPPSALEAGITLDIDFLGTLEEAKATRKKLAEALGTRVDIVPASMDDATPNSAKLLVRNFHSRTDPVEIDFLFGLAGYLPPDEALLRECAVEIDLDQTQIRVMHPIDCLLSRVRNVERLPEKRGPASIAQCRLAIAVMNAYLTEVCRLGAEAQRRRGLRTVERVAELAQSDAGIYLKTAFDIDVLDAVPVENFESKNFGKFAGRRSRNPLPKPSRSSNVNASDGASARSRPDPETTTPAQGGRVVIADAGITAATFVPERRRSSARGSFRRSCRRCP